jgi:hypothetical protein
MENGMNIKPDAAGESVGPSVSGIKLAGNLFVRLRVFLLAGNISNRETSHRSVLMPHDFNEINVSDDDASDMDIIKDIINTEKPEDAFYVADIGDIIKRHNEWINKMPKVIPHYGTFID